ncbi:hypothetical protein EVJ24_12565 [Exiguobacterium sp. SH1S21]|uniref:hypothetical protein n=1 Tax=unclassified Exiguobacterium TaxID=2644629 RepID=UPI001040B5DF|nr:MULTISPECIES: hypothetical protein [unclassified Exiguobacterium]TCI51958.1 hypothetical protein EVJ24_12565 [Exiguobacterium sp. SH1S21]TCI69094.1 hypothetical protein EVJ22_11535 [Exiguobacterium sp. SH0S7]
MDGRKMAIGAGIGLVVGGTIFGVSSHLLFLIASVLFYRWHRRKAGQYPTSIRERLFWRSSEKTWLVAIIVFIVIFLIGFGATRVTQSTQQFALTALTYLFATKGLFLMNEIHMYEQAVEQEQDER